MKFTSKQAYERYQQCRDYALANRMTDSLNRVFARMLDLERPYSDECSPSQEVFISNDFMDKSFYFEVVTSDGRVTFNGGIIFSNGWSIHT